MKPAKRKQPYRRHSRSFTPVVNLKPEETCSLARHYRSVMREVIGYLDMLAANNKERFVYAGVDDITEHCKQFATKKGYSKTAVEQALHEFRKRNIISKRLIRTTRFGREMVGFIVAPHDCLAVRKGSQCVFMGQLRAPGRWERSAGTPCEAHQNSGYDATCSDCKQGIIFWAGYSVNQRATSDKPAALVSQSENKCADTCTDESTDNCTEKSTDNCTDGVSGQATENANTSLHKSAVNRCSHSTEGAEGTDVTVYDAANGNTKSKSGDSASGSSSKSMNDETIGQHFGVPWLPSDDFNLLTDELLNTRTNEWRDFGYEAMRDLCDCCNQVIREFAAQPFRGAETNAMIMDNGMKRFLAAHKTKVPRSWLKVMHDLRRANT